jgi:hypothetical protein
MSRESAKGWEVWYVKVSALILEKAAAKIL